MIIEGILNLLKALLMFLLGLFPTLPTFSDSGGFLTSLSNAISYANYFFHLDVVVSCLVLCFVVSNARAIWALVMWVVRKIPGVS